MVKIFQILFRKFLPPHRSTLLCSDVVNFVRREIGEIVRCLHDKKNKTSAPSQTVATARIAPKIRRGYPSTFASQCSRFNPNRFTFGGVIARGVATEWTGVVMSATFARCVHVPDIDADPLRLF